MAFQCHVHSTHIDVSKKATRLIGHVSCGRRNIWQQFWTHCAGCMMRRHAKHRGTTHHLAKSNYYTCLWVCTSQAGSKSVHPKNKNTSCRNPAETILKPTRASDSDFSCFIILHLHQLPLQLQKSTCSHDSVLHGIQMCRCCKCFRAKVLQDITRHVVTSWLQSSDSRNCRTTPRLFGPTKFCETFRGVS